MVEVVPIAGAEAYRPPKVYRVATGVMGRSKTGQPIPQKLDYFIITRVSPGGEHFVIDQEAQQRLVEATGEEKPRWVPVRLLRNRPEDVIFAERAVFTRTQRVCHCGAFRLKTEQEARRDGLPWPPPGGEVGEEYRIGTAVRWQDGQKKEVECNPYRCPLATGEGEQGRVCKPHVVVRFQLPFLGGGANAYLTTTGWRSLKCLFTSLREIAAQTAGWLALLPLRLCVTWERAVIKLGSRWAAQRIPVYYFDTSLPAEELLDHAEAIARRVAEGRERLAALVQRAQRAALPEPEEHRQAIAAEFWPEASEAAEKLQEMNGEEAAGQQQNEGEGEEVAPEELPLFGE